MVVLIDIARTCGINRWEFHNQSPPRIRFKGVVQRESWATVDVVEAGHSTGPIGFTRIPRDPIQNCATAPRPSTILQTQAGPGATVVERLAPQLGQTSQAIEDPLGFCSRFKVNQRAAKGFGVARGFVPTDGGRQQDCLVGAPCAAILKFPFAFQNVRRIFELQQYVAERIDLIVPRAIGIDHAEIFAQWGFVGFSGSPVGPVQGFIGEPTPASQGFFVAFLHQPDGGGATHLCGRHLGDDEVVFFRCGQRGGSAAQAFCHIKHVLPTAPSAQTKHGVSATRGCVHGEW